MFRLFFSSHTDNLVHGCVYWKTHVAYVASKSPVHVVIENITKSHWRRENYVGPSCDLVTLQVQNC